MNSNIGILKHVVWKQDELVIILNTNKTTLWELNGKVSAHSMSLQLLSNCNCGTIK